MGFLQVEDIIPIAATGSKGSTMVVSEVLEAADGIKSEMLAEGEGRGSIELWASNVDKVERGSVGRAEEAIIKC